MKTNKDLVKEYTKETLGKRKGDLNNAAVVNKIGNEFEGAGLRDIDKADSEENKVNADTMFAEGSISKLRYAGLAYMMEQEGIFGKEGLNQNAKEFFAQEEVGNYLNQKYPEMNLQNAILNLFTDGSEEAKLPDLTTHRSGIGDTTMDVLKMVEARGSEYPFTLPDLVLRQPESYIPRDEVTEKPMAKKGLDGILALAVYGEHEYSNLGYQILAVAMEAAYFLHTGIEKDYQQLIEDFMLHPIEGRLVKEGREIVKDLSFDSTKFPKDLKPDDNVIQAKMIEKDKDKNDVVKNVNNMSSAHAAGGMFSSANDSTKFFSEYFKGFPGTREYGNNVNPFFTPETIAKMEEEAHKFPTYPNQPLIDAAKVELEEWNKRNVDGELSKVDPKPDIPNPQFQFPGATALTDSKGDIVSYEKGGGTLGYSSYLKFDTKSGEVNISMTNQENLTSHREKLKEKEKGSITAPIIGENKWVKNLSLEKKSEEEVKSFTKNVTNDPTKDKSSGGSHAL